MGALFTAKFEDANTTIGAYKISFALCLTFLEVNNRQIHEDLSPSPLPDHIGVPVKIFYSLCGQCGKHPY
jgi:hypothetical protein